MARYGAFITGVKSSDLRCVFPLFALPMDSEEDPETYPYIWFDLDEAVEYTYRVAKIRIYVSIQFLDDPLLDVDITEDHWMSPNVNGLGDERDIPRNSFGLGAVLGTSIGFVGSVLPNLGIISYKASNQTFRMAFPFTTDLAHSALGTTTSTTVGEYGATAAVLNVFGHTTPLTYPTILGPTPNVSGGVTITPIRWRAYADQNGLNPRYDVLTGNPLIPGRVPGYG